MLLGLAEKAENYFIGKSLSGEYIKINDFELDEDIELGAVIEVDLKNSKYRKLVLFYYNIKYYCDII